LTPESQRRTVALRALHLAAVDSEIEQRRLHRDREGFRPGLPYEEARPR